ncbi:MAG: GntR family transcriptional regulator [Rhodospirillales bacterium]|nr:GntR family transcriptional regulator [Rhodospirillales bacterium]
MAPLKTLERPRSLGDRAYHSLREHLRSGLIGSGQPLQEESLAAQLGVSRTPVREALTRLASEGLLVSVGRSFVVPSLTGRDVEEIYELRLMLEPEALRRVASGLPDQRALRPLREGLVAMRTAHAAADAEAFMNANYGFRAAWMDLVPNRKLVRAIELYADHVRYLRSLTLDDAATREVVMRGLERVADALAAGDGAAAAAAMRAHLLKAKRILGKALQPIATGDGNRGTAG